MATIFFDPMKDTDERHEGGKRTIFDVLWGNASEAERKSLQGELQQILCNDEQAIKAFRPIRDFFLQIGG